MKNNFDPLAIIRFSLLQLKIKGMRGTDLVAHSQVRVDAAGFHSSN